MTPGIQFLVGKIAWVFQEYEIMYGQNAFGGVNRGQNKMGTVEDVQRTDESIYRRPPNPAPKGLHNTAGNP